MLTEDHWVCIMTFNEFDKRIEVDVFVLKFLQQFNWNIYMSFDHSTWASIDNVSGQSPVQTNYEARVMSYAFMLIEFHTSLPILITYTDILNISNKNNYT